MEVIGENSDWKWEHVASLESAEVAPEVGSGVEARSVMDGIRVVARKMSSDSEMKSLNPYLRRLEERLLETYFPDAPIFSADYRTGSPDLVDFARSSAAMEMDSCVPKHMWMDMRRATAEGRLSSLDLDEAERERTLTWISGLGGDKRSRSPATLSEDSLLPLEKRFPNQESPVVSSSDIAVSVEDMSDGRSSQHMSAEETLQVPRMPYDRYSVSGESELFDIVEDLESDFGRSRTISTMSSVTFVGQDELYDDRTLKQSLGLPDVLTVLPVLFRKGNRVIVWCLFREVVKLDIGS